ARGQRADIDVVAGHARLVAGDDHLDQVLGTEHAADLRRRGLRDATGRAEVLFLQHVADGLALYHAEAAGAVHHVGDHRLDAVHRYRLVSERNVRGIAVA